MNKIQGHEILVELDRSAPWGAMDRVSENSRWVFCMWNGAKNWTETRKRWWYNHEWYSYCLWDEPGGGMNKRNGREKGLIRTLPYGMPWEKWTGARHQSFYLWNATKSWSSTRWEMMIQPWIHFDSTAVIKKSCFLYRAYRTSEWWALGWVDASWVCITLYVECNKKLKLHKGEMMIQPWIYFDSTAVIKKSCIDLKYF